MKVRNIIGAVVVSATVFGAVYGAAATFVVHAGTVQQGTDLTLSCQTAPVQVESWGINSSDDAVTGGKATFVQLSGVNDATCAGNRLMGSVLDSSGNVIGYLTTIDPATGGASTSPAAVLITNGGPYAKPHVGPGEYKFELIEEDGSHGISAAAIGGLTLWIEGSAG
jgi:hypothetical protein